MGGLRAGRVRCAWCQACGGDKMAAPRRTREEKDEEGAAAVDVSLEAKRPRGQRRLLVVLEGASLETVKVRAGGCGVWPGRKRPQ